MIIIETCPECGHDLVDTLLASYPPIPKKICPRCGWSWTGESERVIRIPFDGNNYISNKTYLTELNYRASPCVNCSNSPANGGSGICNCTLGQPKIT